MSLHGMCTCFQSLYTAHFRIISQKIECQCKWHCKNHTQYHCKKPRSQKKLIPVNHAFHSLSRIYHISHIIEWNLHHCIDQRHDQSSNQHSVRLVMKHVQQITQAVIPASADIQLHIAVSGTEDHSYQRYNKHKNFA